MLLHGAYHTSPRALRRYWFPFLSLAVFAGLVTAAMVAPPDAPASEAVLGEVGIPAAGCYGSRARANDATALLLFGLAVAFATHSDTPMTPLALAAAVPGGIVFGALSAAIYLRVAPLFAGTLGASLADFAVTFGICLQSAAI